MAWGEAADVAVAEVAAADVVAVAVVVVRMWTLAWVVPVVVPVGAWAVPVEPEAVALRVAVPRPKPLCWFAGRVLCP